MDLQLIGGIIGIAIHIPLLIGIWKGTIKQSFATYALWSLLDGIAAYTIYRQDGNFWLPFLYSVGSGLASLSLLLKKNFQWGKMEWFVLVLVIVCLVVQYTTGNFYAMIASILSLLIASIPQVIDTYQKPENSPTKIYIVFCVANLVSLAGAESFELKEILYPISSLMICLTVTFLSLRKLEKSLN